MSIVGSWMRRTHWQILHRTSKGNETLCKRWPYLQECEQACDGVTPAFECALLELRRDVAHVLGFGEGVGSRKFGADGNRNDTHVPANCKWLASESAAEFPHQVADLGHDSEHRDGTPYREEDHEPISPECSTHRANRTD